MLFYAFIFVFLVVAYILLVRPVLVNMPVLAKAFQDEATIVTKIRIALAGWKTRLFSRFLALAGVFLTVYDHALPVVMGQDWTPLTAKVPAWTLPVGLTLIGIIVGWLREVTEHPPQIVTQRADDGTVHVVAFDGSKGG